jgi:hypothetical protein
MEEQHLMAGRFIAERDYLRAEFDSSANLGHRVVGQMLDAAFEDAPSSRQLDELVERIEVSEHSGLQRGRR